jgi:hypothetical protein
VLHRLGLEIGRPSLETYRAYFREQKPAEQVDRVLKLANVQTVVMTNDPLDAQEREIWMRGFEGDPRFEAALRIDPVLLNWPDVCGPLSTLGYAVAPEMSPATLREAGRFISDWLDRLRAMYIAVSLPPDWRYPDDSPSTRILQQVLLPIARERSIPFAMMIGVRRQVNPQLRMAGDSLGCADLASLDRICVDNPSNRFLVTVLSRENQHGLAVAARKHRNLMIFGCWWFVNNPSLIDEITRMRMELLGTSFIPQHSDARVLEQLIYKWDHSRKIVARVLTDKFADLAASGWPVSRDEIKRTAHQLLNGNCQAYLTPAAK